MRRATLALAVAGIVAGCGGGEDSGLTRAEYIDRGDALCRESARYYREEFDPAFREIDEQAEGSDELDLFFARYARLVERETEVFEEHVENFAALKPPQEAGDTHDAIVRDLRAQLGLLRGTVEAYREQDFEAAEARTREYERIDERLERVVREYGFADCARPG